MSDNPHLERKLLDRLAESPATLPALLVELDESREAVIAALDRLVDDGRLQPPSDEYALACPPEPAELVDFARVWHAFVREDDDNRLEASVDRKFWEEHADSYDNSCGVNVESVATVLEHVHPNDSVLDVGAGTGRFTLPVAERASRVTALDHSPAMLAVLEKKVAERSIVSVELVEAAWETADVEAHDIVLAAWSLYRQPELLTALEKMVKYANQTLILVDSAAAVPPHRRIVDDALDREQVERVPRYLYYAGALQQLGYYADIRVAREPHLLQAASGEALVRELVPEAATETDIDRVEPKLLPLFDQRNDGWVYEYEIPVGIVVWNRPTDASSHGERA
ncbi:class I SAM-dependent methyltransferase [Natrialbaceae archaeon A-CW2]